MHPYGAACKHYVMPYNLSFASKFEKMSDLQSSPKRWNTFVQSRSCLASRKPFLSSAIDIMSYSRFTVSNNAEYMWLLDSFRYFWQCVHSPVGQMKRSYEICWIKSALISGVWKLKTRILRIKTMWTHYMSTNNQPGWTKYFKEPEYSVNGIHIFWCTKLTPEYMAI